MQVYEYSPSTLQILEQISIPRPPRKDAIDETVVSLNILLDFLCHISNGRLRTLQSCIHYACLCWYGLFASYVVRVIRWRNISERVS